MIKIDYIIERKLSDNNIQILKPNVIPSELPNIVYIEGPNDSGKSTMLNLIALGFFGIKNDSVKGSLKLKLKSFMDTNYQTLKFSVELFNENKSIYLRAKKEDFNDDNIIVEENLNSKGYKPLSWESFKKKYNLIYDIPEKPTERLSGLLNELEFQQYRIGENVRIFNNYLRDIINEINEFRNPERVKQLKEKIAEMKKDVKDYEINIPVREKILQDLKIYYYFTSYCMNLNAFSMIYDKLEKLSKRYKENKGKKMKSGGEIQGLRGNISHNIDEIFRIKNEVKPNLLKYVYNNNKKKYAEWDEIPVYTRDIIDERLNILVGEHIEKVDKELNEIEKDNDYKSSYVLKDIIQYIEKYENSNLLLTKLEINLKDLIKILKEENKKYEQLQLKFSAMSTLKISLKIIETDINNTTNLIKQLSTKNIEQGTYTTEDLGELKRQINENGRLLKEVEGKVSFFSTKCIECGIDEKYLENNQPEMLQQFSSNKDLDPFFSLKSDELYSKITTINTEIVNSKSDYETKRSLIEEYGGDLKKLESKGEHKYEKNIDALNILFEKSEKLSGKILFNYTKLIKNVKDGNIDKKNMDDKIYYECIFKYLGIKINYFWYMDKQYEADKIDLLDNLIYTKDGNIIRINDLGTGRGQSAYLKGLLNIYNDNRKIIALFDEISAMDRKSLQPIFGKICELYSEDKLLVGMLVQKLEDKVNVVPLEELI